MCLRIKASTPPEGVLRRKKTELKHVVKWPRWLLWGHCLPREHPTYTLTEASAWFLLPLMHLSPIKSHMAIWACWAGKGRTVPRPGKAPALESSLPLRPRGEGRFGSLMAQSLPESKTLPNMIFWPNLEWDGKALLNERGSGQHNISDHCMEQDDRSYVYPNQTRPRELLERSRHLYFGRTRWAQTSLSHLFVPNHKSHPHPILYTLTL